MNLLLVQKDRMGGLQGAKSIPPGTRTLNLQMAIFRSLTRYLLLVNKVLS